MRDPIQLVPLSRVAEILDNSDRIVALGNHVAQLAEEEGRRRAALELALSQVLGAAQRILGITLPHLPPDVAELVRSEVADAARSANRGMGLEVSGE